MSTVALLAGMATGTLAHYFAMGAAKLARWRDNRECGRPPAALKRGPYPEPYHPTEADLREYHQWSEGLDLQAPICPADFGHYCEDCDREMAQAWAEREAEAEGNGWYIDMVMRASNDPHSPYREGVGE